MEILFRVKAWYDITFMFVTPHHEIQQIGEEVLWEVVRVTVGVVVLMDSHQVEPIFLLHTGFEEFDIVISKGSEEAFISNITQPI
jgi:hypothetical protein